MASILIADTYYPGFLSAHGLSQVRDSSFEFAEGLRDASEQGFGTGAAYQAEFEAIGWDSQLVIPNSLALQQAWAREQAPRTSVIPFGWKYALHAARLPGAGRFLRYLPWVQGVFLQQVKELRPDVVYIQDVNLLPPRLVAELKSHAKLVVGEIASPPPPRSFFKNYDLLISALPPLVDTFRSWGIPAEYVPLAFDARHTTVSPAHSRPIDAIFVGSFSRHQPNTASLLKAVSRRVPTLQIYGAVDSELLDREGLRPFYRGEAWGNEMFKLLGSSKVVVNRHGPISGDFAVNMRMYESTGCGAALVTEVKSNLATFFEPGSEVLAYQTNDQAAELTAGLIADPELLDRVARAGQQRTLRDHTYRNRVEQLYGILTRHLGR